MTQCTECKDTGRVTVVRNGVQVLEPCAACRPQVQAGPPDAGAVREEGNVRIFWGASKKGTSMEDVTIQPVEGTYGHLFAVVVNGERVAKVKRYQLREALGIEKVARSAPDDQPLTRLDLPPERILAAAAEAKLELCIVVGELPNGEFYFASNHADGPDVLWALERAKLALLKAGGAA